MPRPARLPAFLLTLVVLVARRGASHYGATAGVINALRTRSG